MFEAVILAGGKGTRLREVSNGIPKPMVEVAGKPFLFKLMTQLERCGCSRIVLSLGYKHNYIEEAVLSNKPVNIPVEFSIETTPLYTGGAIKLAANLVKSDRFLVLNGDTWTDLDFGEFYKFSLDSDMAVCGVMLDDVSRYGKLTLDDCNNVIALGEKTNSGVGLINGGTYALKKEDIGRFPDDKFSLEKDYIPSFTGSFKAMVYKGLFIDIGVPEDYYRACEILK